MNIHELDSYNLGDAVRFHRRLNPRIWGRDEHLLPEVRERLLAIAADFQEFLGVDDLNVEDITISGSNAAYSYTKNSDIDLHLVVEMPDDPVYQELFAAKKYQYNDEHNIKIGGADVELYVQPADQPHISQGIYSVKDNSWISIPQRKRARVDDVCVRDKVADLDARIHDAVRSGDESKIATLADKIKAMRQSGLEQQGEFGCENLAFKMLRNSGCIKLLWDARRAAQDRELSLREADRPQQRFRYGFSEGHQGQPYSSEDGVAASTKQFLEDSDSETNLVQEFIQHTATELGIDPVPEIHLHTDPEWSTRNQSFGRYDPRSHTLNVSMPNRHILDVLRTVAHELVHCSQNQQHNGLPDDAGETGSRWENDANARAGIIMRDWANSHPEHFELPALGESASGYIPKNKKEAARPQYAMALSVDITPGQVGKEANKLGLKTGRNGEPGLLMPEAQNLLREFAEFTEEQDNLFEITMSPSSLRKLSAQTGALAGMEFEMIVPNIEGGDDVDQEPDYEYDERCRSIEDAAQFFYDGDFNGRRDVERMRERMQNDFQEWLDDKLYRDWERSGEEYLEEWVPNNIDESEWNPEGLEGDARQEALEELIANMHSDPGGSDAFDEYREENQESYDESDWLDAEDLDMMSSIENAYSMSWPHWTTPGRGEGSIEDVADSFRDAVGRPILASSSYHSGRVERPSTKNLQYIVEPDGSLNPDDSDDQGLEFVSPPLPIEELLSDLNKVKAWADKTGCYTNDSTGLHINVSVPGWTQGTDQLDYVKLALLLGDEFVLDSFGRAGNTYAKSAMGKIVDIVKQRPDRAQLLMNRMKQGLDQLATRLVHGRQTEKYTSINVKDGYIEFRSPGGDWLNDKFPEIENTLRRFTVALSAAVDPAAYRQEYLKKLYKLLDVSGEKDPLSYFAKYAAGELPQAALKSFVRQAQLERSVKRDKTGGKKMWWSVTNPPQSSAGIEVVATSKEEAIEKALGADGYPAWANTRQSVVAKPLRPYEEPAAQQEPQGVDTRVDYELYSRASGAVIDTFPARNDDEAQIRLDDYREHGAGQSNPDNFGVRRGPGTSAAASTTASHPEGRGRPHDPTGRYAIVARSDQAAYGRTGGPAPNYQFRFNMQNLEDQAYGRYVLQAWAARNSVGPSDYIVVDTTQYADAAQGGTIDVATDQPAPQPAGGEFTGNWLIRAEDGTVLHRFGGIGNSQADANRTALAWAQRNPDVMRQHAGGVEVVPEMNESLRESVNDYLWHGSKSEHDILYPQQANDTGGKKESNKNAVYATPSARVAIAMGLTTPGSDTGMFPNDPQMVLFNGGIRKGQMIYLHKVPKNLFIKHNDREWYSKPGVKEVKPLEVVTVPVDKWLHLIRQATPADLELQKKYTQKQNVKEYKMPQPSQGPGRYRDLNEPLGPETPPKMPAGTIKVDVSDTQDWYQLGQDISNLDIANKAHYNQGPPHTVLAFGSEDLEHMYIQQLKRLGLNTHDLDESGEDDMDKGINEGNQLTLRDFVVTVSPHALSQAHNKGVDVHMVDNILRNISKVKDNIMSLEPGRALILHNGQGTGLGVRRGQGNNLTLATVFPTNPGFRKGKHPTFQVEANEVDEGVRSALATAALAGTMAMGAQAKAPEMVHQTVEPGDTVYSIARQNNVNPLEIYRLNKMDRNTKLEVGQRVVVPDYSKPVSKMPATVAPTVKQPPAQAAPPAPSLKDKISSMLPKFPDDDEGVVLLSDNPDAEAALQTAAKAAGLKGSELAQFMAQTRHESWDFGKMKEVGNKKQFAKYDAPRKAKQLGNKVRGDGERFKGRGFIQLTGRDNYTRASQQIFGDDRLVKNPDLASKLDVGAQIALWFWKNQVRPVVKDFNNTTQVVKAINADEPAKVVQARHNKFKEYLAVL